jgi:hypothetical protein
VYTRPEIGHSTTWSAATAGSVGHSGTSAASRAPCPG